MPTSKKNVKLLHLGKVNQELKKIATFYSNRIWGVAYDGEIKYSTTVPESYGRLENDNYLITINTLFIKEELIFMLHHIVFEELFFWWNSRNNIKYNNADLYKELRKYKICSNETVYVYKGKPHTGIVDPVEWEPRIGLIQIVSEYEAHSNS
ncbi:hypothetical protein ACFVQB_14780 [Paenibacillus sp. NPDC057886]|uniref:hypothetical protein n=1 Tax=Paenibacillus sp. NPDC057886 TaxID=3346270 RepID=UPI0036AF3343